VNPALSILQHIDFISMAPGLRKLRAWCRRLGMGIITDIRARTPWYLSDWVDAWNYRVVPATTLIFFAKFVQ